MNQGVTYTRYPACFRCHEQKLRCTQVNGQPGCVRCSRVDVQCLVRPSKRGLRGKNTTLPPTVLAVSTSNQEEFQPSMSSDSHLEGGHGIRDSSHHNSMNSTDMSMTSLWDEPRSTSPVTLQYVDNDFDLSASPFNFVLESPVGATVELKHPGRSEDHLESHIGLQNESVITKAKPPKQDELGGHGTESWVEKLFSLNISLGKHRKLISASVERVQASISQSAFTEPYQDPTSNNVARVQGNINDCPNKADHTRPHITGNDGANVDSCLISRTVELALQLLSLLNEVYQFAKQPLISKARTQEDGEQRSNSKPVGSGNVLQDKSNALLLLSSYTLILELFCTGLQYYQRLAVSREASGHSLEDRLSLVSQLLPCVKIGSVQMTSPPRIHILLVANSVEIVANELHCKMHSTLSCYGYINERPDSNRDDMLATAENTTGDSGVARDTAAEWNAILEDVYLTMTETSADLRSMLGNQMNYTGEL